MNFIDDGVQVEKKQLVVKAPTQPQNGVMDRSIFNQ